MDDGAFQLYTLACGGVIEGLEQFLSVGVVAAALDGLGAWAGVGEEVVESDGVHEGAIEEVGAFEAGEGEDDGVELAVFELADAGVDIAADAFNLQVGANGQELTAAAEGAGADFGIGREILDRTGFRGDQDVADIFALGNGGDDEIRLLDQRHGDGHVFEAVDDEIDFAIEQRLLQLADEEAFAPKLVEGAVCDLVAGGFESCETHLERWMDPLELVYDEVGLGEREG